MAGDAPDALPLEVDIRADVAIVGGGYVGLWTAIRIKELEPSCDVVVLEQDICGGGASGRNGGFALSWWPKISSLVKLCGTTDALRIAQDSEDAIDEIRQFSLRHGIDVHFRQAGWLWTATSHAQLNAWEGVVRTCERMGTGVNAFLRLPNADVARRSGSSAHRAGVLESRGATVHPAALVRGLRRVALELGVRIYEQTRVGHIRRGAPVVLTTPNGTLTAERLVIATNAWAAGMREFSRSIVAISSDVVVTEAVPEHFARLGWTGGECITDSQMMVCYYHVTRDGRLVFGKGGWGIAYAGNIGPDFDRNTSRMHTVVQDMHRYYPTLRDVAVTHDWSGPIDRTPNSLPLLGRFLAHPNIVYGVGWSGNGVAPSVIGGRVLASLALDRDDSWARYPLVNRSVGSFPPEPFRYVGAHIVRAAVASKERAEIEGRRASAIATRLSRLAPAGLEDKD
ncbi:MAG: FAD-binding oxidoreductase [Gemmatimonadaceae bacterium]